MYYIIVLYYYWLYINKIEKLETCLNLSGCVTQWHVPNMVKKCDLQFDSLENRKYNIAHVQWPKWIIYFRKRESVALLYVEGTLHRAQFGSSRYNQSARSDTCSSPIRLGALHDLCPFWLSFKKQDSNSYRTSSWHIHLGRHLLFDLVDLLFDLHSLPPIPRGAVWPLTLHPPLIATPKPLPYHHSTL